MFRRAKEEDIDRIVQIYDAIHDREEAGILSIGWKRDVYPTKQTVVDAISRNDMFVEIENETIVAAAIINQIQVPEYKDCKWRYSAEAQEVMVLHTLTVAPEWTGYGFAKKFVYYYEEYARNCGCHYLRMDTNAKNKAARNLYAGLGYCESGIVPCEFNGIPGVQLVCLEKSIVAV